MKQSITKNKFSKIPKSKTNKISFELSLKAKNRFSKFKYDSVNKETIDGSCVDSLLFNPESLNNSKTTKCKNNSLGKIDNNKLIMFTSSLKYHPFDSKKKIQLCSKGKLSKKAFELSEENESNIDNNHTVLQNEGNELSEHFLDEDDTDRIDYRYYPKIPEIELNKENKYYWLATYDKLMKKSKIIKILNYYTDADKKGENEKSLCDEQYNFKEKTMIVPGFEIYFLENFNKPFIRPKNGGKIFIKLFLLNIEQINKIFSYINRLEYKFYINDLDIITEKYLYKNIINFNKSIYNYSTIFCLGSFMNTNIYLFSHIEKNKKIEKTNLKELPSSHKLAKLIKVLMLNFPDYKKNDFINYLTDFMKDENCTNSLIDKRREVSTLISSANKKSLKLGHKNKISTNSVIKNIIQKIPTNTISSYNTPNEFNNLSESNINNISEINKVKNTHDINSFDFFNRINNGMEIKKQISEKILKKIDSNSFYLKNKLNTKNSKNTISSRNFKNCSVSIKRKNIKKLRTKMNNLSSSINHTQLMNPIKKCLTRTNTNKSSIYYKKGDDSTINTKANINKNRILNSKFNFVKKFDNDKENNLNYLNTYQNGKENCNTDISFKNISNNNIIKTEINKQNTRNKIKTNFNPFYYTNTNNSNNNKKIIMGKKPIRVLSSIRKIISQKLSNISGNSSSLFKNVNMNNSNNSFQNNVITGNKLNYKKLVCMSNNNSKNKTTEYITPRKKRFYYYYH